ncbi:hypothetical protein Rsub_05187 [Raphidocelis subcapitata]|uniref:Strictosidine synthase conserved region domain-containing protein n=1 Tax=Raphidocelis subcapitata TaxID=307507 RepID=A0A2V0P3Z3_9CHLO|nr:hypothetical protein Rsub_05187 [Raphidocelis subcapitata]|eukprot:GBF92573.1 hypothetical protein Rsub_05187 [Raphidocelis subcapitata]
MGAFFTASALGTLAVLGLLAGVEYGAVPVPLRSPPARPGERMGEPPAGSLPFAFDGRFDSRNAALRGAARWFEADGVAGVETVAVAPNGTLALIGERGEVWIADAAGADGFAPPRRIARLPPGRPLGAVFDADGAVVAALAPVGLFRISAGGGAERIAAASKVGARSEIAPGADLGFTNDMDIGSDGVIYYSHSTHVGPFEMPDGRWNALESVYTSLGAARPSGLLLRHDPATGATTALTGGLWFANGVALSKGEDFVVVADSIQAKLLRHWLRGPRRGETDTFAANLPGPPDGVSRASDGGFWVAIYGRYPPVMNLAAHRLVRAAVALTPPRLRPPTPPRGLVLKLSEAGGVEFALEDPDGSVVRGVTSAVEAPDGRLWLGSLHEKGVQALDLPQPLRALRTAGGPDAEAAGRLVRRLEARRAAAVGSARAAAQAARRGAGADAEEAGGHTEL